MQMLSSETILKMVEMQQQIFLMVFYTIGIILVDKHIILDNILVDMQLIH